MTEPAPRAVLVDLLMATMDSMSAWTAAAGDRALGLRWRDAVTERMIAAGRYARYEELVARSADELGLGADASERLWAAWGEMRPWPDAAALRTLDVPLAFVTNCSTALAGVAVARSGVAPLAAITAEEAGWYKPRPEIYRAACERLGVAPTAARFIAGAAYDADGAARVGFDVRLVIRRPAPGRLAPGVSLARTLDEAIASD